MKSLRSMLVVFAVAAATFLPLGGATAATVVGPGTNIGNAGVLTGSNSGASSLTATSEDWWVIYLPSSGVAPNVVIDNTSAAGGCPLETELYATEGTNQGVASSEEAIPGDIIILTDLQTGLASDRYFVAVWQDPSCGIEGNNSTTPYTISLPPGTGTGTPPDPQTGYVAGSAASASAWPPLQGHAYYTGTLGTVSWYALYKKPDSASATIRVQDTTPTGDSSSAGDFTATLYTSSLTQVSTIIMGDDEATTLTIPGQRAGDPQDLYYLKIASTGADLPNTTVYTVETEPAGEWVTPSQALPSGTWRLGGAGPLPGGVTFGAALAPGTGKWSYFTASGAATAQVQNLLGAGCPVNAQVDNSAGAKVAAATLAAGHVAGLRVSKAGTYYVSLSTAAGCAPKTTATVLMKLSGGVRAPVLHVLNPRLKTGVVHRAYRCTIGVSGGKKPYTFSALSALPPGLRLARTTGVITGSPTKAGTYTFPVVVKDSAHNSTTMPITIVVT
jgi:large repetitive protein